LDRCKEKVRDPIIVLKDSKSKAKQKFLNSQGHPVLKVRIDGCLVAEETACDYLIQHNSVNYFVELKGHDILHALNQIVESINKFNKDFGSCQCVAVISATKVPAIVGFHKAFMAVQKRCGHLRSDFYLVRSEQQRSV
jgi:hypothetical protein